jgi:hypothetical protein
MRNDSHTTMIGDLDMGAIDGLPSFHWHGASVPAPGVYGWVEVTA